MTERALFAYEQLLLLGAVSCMKSRGRLFFSFVLNETVLPRANAERARELAMAMAMAMLAQASG